MRAGTFRPSAILALAFVGSIAALVAVAQEAVERWPDLWDTAGHASIAAPAVRVVGIGLTAVGGGTGVLLLGALLVAFLILGGRSYEAIFVTVAIVGADVVDRVFKSVFQRPRPATADAAGIAFADGLDKLLLLGIIALGVALFVILARPRRWRLVGLLAAGVFAGAFLLEKLAEVVVPIRPGFDSFPSGHAAGSMALAASVAIVAWPSPKRWAAVVGGGIFTFLVGVSRVWLGFHHPSDVLGGWSLALGWVVGCWLILGLATVVIQKRDRRRSVDRS